MSCESRHRDIVARLLTLAGLSGKVSVDNIIRVGIGTRHRTQGTLNARGVAWNWIHPDVKTALGLESHADQMAPSWIDPMIITLRKEVEKENRDAFLTLLLLTGGVDAVTPCLTDEDRGWIVTAQRMMKMHPPAWDLVADSRSIIANVGRMLSHPTSTAVLFLDVLQALHRIDAIPPESIPTVTPSRILRLVFGHSFPSLIDKQRILRAVLENTSVVRETVKRLISLCGSAWYTTHTPMGRFLPLLTGCAFDGTNRSIEQTGRHAIPTMIAKWVRKAHGDSIDPAALCNPSSDQMEHIIRFLCEGVFNRSDQVTLSLVALVHIWRTNDRDDAVAEVNRRLGQTITAYRKKLPIFPVTVAAIMSGVVSPPYGDAVVSNLGFISPHDITWPILAASAVYAAACQRIEHQPMIGDEIQNLMRNRWRSRYRDTILRDPLPFPVLAIGRERELLLPVLHADRGTDEWVEKVLDCIDGMDMLDTIGGCPQALQSVLLEVLTMEHTVLDPRIVVRLAASRCGHAILAQRSTVDMPPVVTADKMRTYVRVLNHLVSPWWDMAPWHLHDWWQHTIQQVAESPWNFRLDTPLLLYPTKWSQAVMVRPTLPLISHAMNHPQWDDLPEAQRRSCLRGAFKTIRPLKPEHVLTVASHARTATALHDIEAIVATMDELSDADKHTLRWFIHPNGWQP